MIEEVYNLIRELLDTYRPQIMWGALFVLFIRTIRYSLKDDTERYCLKTRKGEKFKIKPSKKSIKNAEWFVLAIIGIIASFTYYLVLTFGNAKDASTFLFVIMSYLKISLFDSDLPQIEILQDKIILDREKITAKQIQSIKIWDNLIVVHLTTEKQIDFPLNFRYESFNVVIKMIASLSQRRRDMDAVVYKQQQFPP